MAISQKTDAYTKHLGKFNGKQYGILSILKTTHIRNYKADLLQKYGCKCLQGGVQGLPKIHTLLGLKDSKKVLTDAELVSAGEKAASRTKTIIYNTLERLYDDYFGANGQAQFMEFCKLLPNQKLPDATSPVIARCYANKYDIIDQKYLHDDYWYIRSAFYDFYNDLLKDSTESADDWDEIIQNSKLLGKGIITGKKTDALKNQNLQPFTNQPVSKAPKPLQDTHAFVNLMAQIDSFNPDFHTFLLDCGFNFAGFAANTLKISVKNILFAEMIDNHVFAANLMQLIRNMFGATCTLEYTALKTQAQTQPQTPQPQQQPQPFTDRRTGSTNISNLTAHIPQTPKTPQQEQTPQQKLKTVIAKVGKFNQNYAVELHNSLNFSKIEQNILYCIVTNQEAIHRIENNRDYADLCKHLQQVFEVEGVVIEVYKR